MPTPQEILAEKEKRRRLDEQHKKTYASTEGSGGQRIKTHYKPTSTAYAPSPPMSRDDSNAKRDANVRRAQDLKHEQSTVSYKTKQAVKRAVGTASGWAQQRGREIVAGTDRAAGPVLPRQPSNPFGNMGNNDMFGVSNFGNPFAPPRRPPAPRPASVKRRKRRAPAPPRDDGPLDPFGLGGFKRIF